ncbi:MAG: TolC family protein, partial [Victivallales bacterium]|nr:TolC family protein [Victivallales bacterium]
SSYTAWRHQQTMGGNATAEQNYLKSGVDLQMPLFVPSAWMLYANRKLGMEQAALAAHIARQSVEYNVTVLYYNVLVCEDAVATLKSQVESAASLASRMDAMFREEQIREWEKIEATVQLRSREIALARMERRLETAKGELLQAMGAAPNLAHRISLARDVRQKDGTAAVPELEGLLLSTLSTHPELSIADRTIVQSENSVRAALLSFLPVISGFIDGTWTDDAIADRATNLYGGFAASMDIFKGFSKAADYQASKIGRQQAELERNSLFLTIMIEVITARAQLMDAADALTLAQLNFDAMESRYLDYSRRHQDGLVPAYEMLDAKAARNQAEEALVNSRYQREIAAAVLAMATGSISPPEDVRTPEEDEVQPEIKSDALILKQKEGN